MSQIASLPAPVIADVLSSINTIGVGVWNHPSSGEIRLYLDNLPKPFTPDHKVWLSKSEGGWSIQCMLDRKPDRGQHVIDLARCIKTLGWTWEVIFEAARVFRKFPTTIPNTPATEPQASHAVMSTEDAARFRAMGRNKLLTHISDAGLATGPALWTARRSDLLRFLIDGVALPPYTGDYRAGSKETDAAITEQFPVDRIKNIAQAMVESVVASAVDDEIERRALKPHPRPILVRVESCPDIQISGMVHAKFETVLKLVSADVPVMLVGPAGSGKTKLAEQVAEALGRPFSFNSMSAGVTESSLMGRVLPTESGTWEYKAAPFVTAFENGGVHLIDEMDAADPNLLVQINAAIANKMLSIPFADKLVKRHKKARIVAAANTFGYGADRQYAGRNQLDEATLDRFRMGLVEIGYDQSLETKIVEQLVSDSVGKSLLSWAWATRTKIDSHKLRRLISTRSIENAARLLAVSIPLSEIQASFFRGWSADEIAKTC